MTMSSDFAVLLSVIAARTAIVWGALLLGLRLLGRRQLGQINIYDLALIMALANAVQNAMTEGRGELGIGLVAAATLLLLGRLLAMLLSRRPALEAPLLGTPVVIINNGQLQPTPMRRYHVSEAQIQQAMRQHGLSQISQVRLAVLELDGSLSIVGSDQPT